MTRYFIKRLFLGLLALLCAIFITYMLMATYLESPVKVTGPNDFANMKIIQEQHLNKAPIIRFGYYVIGLFKGDLGIIFNPGTYPEASIPDLFFSKLQNSIIITFPAFILGTIFGFIFGFISGYKRGTWIDSAINIFVVVFVAVPSFVLALFFVILGSKLGFPTSINTYGGTLAFINYIILPVMLLTVTSFSAFTYYIRNEVVAVLTSDFIKVARSKGLSEIKVLFSHVLRNVLIPVSGMIIGGFMGLLSGSLILESFFGADGTAKLLVGAIQKNEINIIMFQLLVFASMGVVATILIDLSYVVLDPRINLSRNDRPTLKMKLKSFLTINKLRKEEKIQEVNND